MGFKFRRRQKLFPGVYINFSLKGISTTIGVKGFNVNVGNKGVYLNTGIPDTGIYDRIKIANWSNKNRSSRSQPQVRNHQPSTTYLPEDPFYFLPKKLEGEIKSSDAKSVTSQDLSDVKETLVAAYQEKNDILDEIPRVEAEVRKAANLKLLSQIFIFGLFTKKFKEQHTAKVEYLEDIRVQYENCKVQLDIHIDQAIESKYQVLRQSFDKLAQSDKVWDKTSAVRNTENKSSASQSIARTQTCISHKRIEFINAEFDALYFKNQNSSDIYIYPAFAVIFDDQNNFGLVNLSDLRLNFRTQKFLEEGEIPRDASIIGETWAKINKDGSPDKRFKGNYKIPIVEYGEIEFKSDSGIFEVFMFSNHNAAHNFVELYNSYTH